MDADVPLYIDSPDKPVSSYDAPMVLIDEWFANVLLQEHQESVDISLFLGIFY
uniref:Uncharacterized protein n=1 Tax=Amphimedon queenslandica TaxID=400682 RepID=A0A1X7U5K1_AMPQE